MSIIIYEGDDSAADWYPEGAYCDYAPSYDEWLALRAAVGLGEADFIDYMIAIDVPLWTAVTVGE